MLCYAALSARELLAQQKQVVLVRYTHKHWQIHVLYYVDIKCNVYSGSLICVCVHAGAWRARKTQVYCNNNKEHGAWQQHRVELLTWS